jgi:FtsH-binding integral membrane protein
MEGPRGIAGRLVEKILGWVALGLLVALGFAIYKLGPEGRQMVWNGIWRTLVWVVIAAALPWSARFFMRRVLEFGSNWAGFVLLALFLLVDIVVGLVLLQHWPTSGWGWVAGLAAVAIAGTYNFLVAEYLSEQAGG